MSDVIVRSAMRADWDQALVDIADYVCTYEVNSPLAFETAAYCVMDTLACGFQALDYPACTKLSRVRSFRARRCPAARESPEPPMNSTRFSRHSTSAR